MKLRAPLPRVLSEPRRSKHPLEQRPSKQQPSRKHPPRKHPRNPSLRPSLRPRWRPRLRSGNPPRPKRRTSSAPSVRSAPSSPRSSDTTTRLRQARQQGPARRTQGPRGARLPRVYPLSPAHRQVSQARAAAGIDGGLREGGEGGDPDRGDHGGPEGRELGDEHAVLGPGCEGLGYPVPHGQDARVRGVASPRVRVGSEGFGVGDGGAGAGEA